MKELIIILLAFLMFIMGLNLKLSDFRSVLKYPRMIILGLLLQYVLMPFLALILSIPLEFEYVIGMLLVGFVPSGLASNIVCYLAKANLALSITLTSLSTILSILITPLLIGLYLGNIVAINGYDIFITLLQIVVIPIALGMFVCHFYSLLLMSIKEALSFISKLTIILIVVLILILNKDNLHNITPLLIILVMLHNIMGLFIGYGLVRLLGGNIIDARTLAIEIAMQNSGLASVIAIKHFTIASSIPAIIFSIWHNISGFSLAIYWSKTKQVKSKIM